MITSPTPDGQKPPEPGSEPAPERPVEPIRRPPGGCPICGSAMAARQCKLTCPNCGYTEDCGDLFPE